MPSDDGNEAFLIGHPVNPWLFEAKNAAVYCVAEKA